MRLRSLPLPLIVAAAVVRAQDPAPEPGLFDPFLVDVGDLQVPYRKGDAQAALDCFVAAHEAHRAGREPEALAGYLEFLGMPGRRDLPGRYRALVQQRVEAIRDRVGERYEIAIERYRTDRRTALVALQPIAQGYPGLPEGQAARCLLDTDATRDAVREAERLSALDRGTEAAEHLEAVVRASPRSLYLYEAKKTLIEVGGPDLFAPEERDSDEEGEPRRPGAQGDDEPESTIEISGDG